METLIVKTIPVPKKTIRAGMGSLKWNVILVFVALCVCFVTHAFAMDVILEWDANAEPDLAGYKIYYKAGGNGAPYDGMTADQGPSPITVSLESLGDPDSPQFELSGLDMNQVYYIVVTAYDNEGLESDYSNEVATVSIVSPEDGFYVNASNFGSYTVSGVGAAGVDVEIFAGNSSLGSTTALSDGSWTKDVDFSSIAEGQVSLTAKAGSTVSDTVAGHYSMAVPFVVGYPTINYTDNIIEVVFSEADMENATDESNYRFSPSLNFATAESGITNQSGNIYSLKMASIPKHTIITLTVRDITDAAGLAVMPATIRINDDDDDDMADDWETYMGVDDPNEDPDSDGLTNLQEFNGGGTLSTDCRNSDTDNDGLTDGWEVAHGLDPLDNMGVNGGDGDFDNDGFTNMQESVNGTNPAEDSSPLIQFMPEIKEVIPHNNAGIGDDTRVSHKVSFCVRIEDSDGIDITAGDSITFTINDGITTEYVRDLRDKSVVRVVKLTDNEDTQVTSLWAIYDRSREEMLGCYPFDAHITIKVDAKDSIQNAMQQTAFHFSIEDSTEHDAAEDPANLPCTSQVDSAEAELERNEYYYDAGVEVNGGELEGAKIIYNSSEPVIPEFGPADELPPYEGNDFEPVGAPLNLQPSTVFTVPVKILIPCPGQADVSELSVFLYNGSAWVLACDASGRVQPGGDAWMVPGSRVNHNTSNPPTIEIAVYHFTGAQAVADSQAFRPTAASSTSTSAAGGEDSSGGGCFIATAAVDAPFTSPAECSNQRQKARPLSLEAGRRFIPECNTYLLNITDGFHRYFPLQAWAPLRLGSKVGAGSTGGFSGHWGCVLIAFVLVAIILRPKASSQTMHSE